MPTLGGLPLIPSFNLLRFVYLPAYLDVWRGLWHIKSRSLSPYDDACANNLKIYRWALEVRTGDIDSRSRTAPPHRFSGYLNSGIAFAHYTQRLEEAHYLYERRYEELEESTETQGTSTFSDTWADWRSQIGIEVEWEREHLRARKELKEWLTAGPDRSGGHLGAQEQKSVQASPRAARLKRLKEGSQLAEYWPDTDQYYKRRRERVQ
ncbi:hypothetical protein PMZ80_007231 [Knufia obscura]|uniref:Uncharacterized protein n=2 Tax=Knufia TaxID=430999 RepID=A0AAN8I7G9_9EURO|nr:hypothetical protein PMZ80_007231 [Knufia obscura]KAK5953241.1 hypothetical protein OHC33_005809 [Knufia fluminis]